MPKDHYIAQTYLKKFSISGKNGFVNVVRKSNLQRIEAVPVKSICYKIDWSSNKFFPENPRIVEEFIKPFEQKWSKCINQILKNTYDINTKYLMSGYLAWLRSCTPTAVRLGNPGTLDMVQGLYDKIEKEEFVSPDSKHREAINMVRRYGGAKVMIDANYTKAMGFTSLVNTQNIFTKSPWIVFRNETSIPLITSDNPVCLQYHDTGLADFYCPLTPKLAIVIHPLREDESRGPDHVMSFKAEGAKKMNQLVAKSAEDKVIFSDCSNVDELVREHQSWRVELKKIQVPFRNGNLMIHQQRPVLYTGHVEMQI